MFSKTKTGLDGSECKAVFSEDMKYRYLLSRKWGISPSIVFIMLNPSIGDENRLEPTTAGISSRARKWGYGGFVVVNLFAYISTNPKLLYEANDPVGSANDNFIKALNDIETPMVVCAWGCHGTILDRDKEVKSFLKMPLYCLGINKNGTPKHPLHMSHSILPEIFKQ